MNTENPIEILITKYLSGNAANEEKHYLLSWMNENHENRILFELMRNTWEGTHPSFQPEEIDVEMARSVVLGKLNKKESQVIRKFLLYWQRTAAILLLPLLLALTYLLVPEKADKTIFQKVFAPYGTYTEVTLPDESKVWLNAGSTLTYPVPFEKGSRDVSLEGEGYFEVHSDRRNPFTVHTYQTEVRATGTAFVVEAYPKDSITAVTMVRGKLGVTLNKQTHLGLLPGERLSFNRNSMECRIEQTDPYKWYAWKDGLMVFRDDPLEYVFKRLGQTFNVEIVVMNEEIATQPYRATFRDESLSEILRLLKLTAPIRYVDYERGTGKNTALRKRKLEVYKMN